MRRFTNHLKINHSVREHNIYDVKEASLSSERGREGHSPKTSTHAQVIRIIESNHC